MRTLTAPKNQEGRRMIVTRLIRAFEKCFANRNARHIEASKISPGFRKMNGRGRNHRCHQPVGKTGNEVGFEGKSWDTGQSPGEHRRTGGVTTHSNHYVGAEL